MSQPVALIAEIRLAEASFKKFLRGKAAKLLAACIADARELSLPDYYIFRYLKTRGVLFAFIYFNHGNAQSLRASRELTVLQALAPLADAGDAGYVLAHLDALNLGPDDVADTWRIIDQQCVEGESLSAATWQELTKDCKKYFYQEVNTEFAVKLGKRRIVDKSIVKRCEAILEERRIEKLSTRFHLASFSRPLHLFGDYYYNGEFVYHIGRRISLLRSLEASRFRPTPFGASDGQHAVIDGKVLDADAATLSKLSKGEMIYYADATSVFDSELQRIADADAASFRLVTDYYAEDRNYLYFAGLRLVKAELGAFKFHPAGYFHCQKLLIAERALYLGPSRLDFDVASFAVVGTHEIQRGAAFDIGYFVRDKNGAWFVSHHTDYRRRDGLQVIKTHDPIAACASLQAQHRADQTADNEWPPRDDAPDALARYRDWAAAHLDRLYTEYRYREALGGAYEQAGWFYRAINNYLYLLGQAGDHPELLRVFKKVEATAWLNPYIFHHVACAYAALGQADEALDAVYKALVFGYEHMDKIWSDPDLALIRDEPRFQSLQHAFGNDELPVVPFDLMRCVAELPDDVGPALADKLLVRLSRRFMLPSQAMVRQWWNEADDAGRQRLDQYAEALRLVYEKRLLLNRVDFAEHAFYKCYRHYEELSVVVHLHVLEYCFRQAHMMGHVLEEYFGYCLDALEAVRRSLALERSPQAQAQIDTLLAENDFLAWVVERLRGGLSF